MAKWRVLFFLVSLVAWATRVDTPVFAQTQTTDEKEDSMKTTLGLAVALVALSPPARDGSQEAVSGTATSPDRIPIRYHAAGKGDPALSITRCRIL